MRVTISACERSVQKKMVSELEQAIKRASKLPDREQRVLASILEQELDDEAGWARRFEESPQVLEMLVRRAKAQYEAGACSEDL
jgi:hypothetical protein